MQVEQRLRLLKVFDACLLASLGLVLGLRLWISGLQAAFTFPSLNLFVDALCLLAALFWLLRRALDQPTPPPLRALLFPALGLLWAGLACLWAADRNEAWRVVCDAGAAFAVLCIVADAAREAAFRELVLRMFLGVALAIACLSLWEVLFELEAARRAYESDPAILALPEAMRAAFVGRLYENAASGSFLISNVLAGFLCLPLCLCCALLFRPEQPRRALCLGLCLLFGLALLATRSKAGIACGGLGCLAGVLGMRPLWRKKLGLAAAALLLLAGVGFSLSVGLRGLEKTPGGVSLAVRLEYWQAGLGATAARPWRGWGPAGFAQTYQEFRPERSEDTRFAHSLAIQALTDLGLPGLLLLALSVYVWMREIAKVVTEGTVCPDTSPPAASRVGAGVLGLALAVALVSLVGLKWRGEKAMALAGLVAAGYLGGGLLMRQLSARVVAVGLGSGLAALGLHGLLDLDFAAPGILLAAALCLGCALSAAQGRAFPGLPLQAFSGLRWAAVLLAAVPFAWLFVGVLPDEVEADGQLKTAAAQLERCEREPAFCGEALVEASAALLQACALRPRDAEPRVELANVLAQRAGRGEPGALEAALAALDEAARLEPRNADLPYRSGMLLLQAGLPERALPHLEAAVAQHPSHPHHHLLLADARFETQDPRAAASYREALRLSERARNDFRRLSAEQQARARQRGGS